MQTRPSLMYKVNLPPMPMELFASGKLFDFRRFLFWVPHIWVNISHQYLIGTREAVNNPQWRKRAPPSIGILSYALNKGEQHISSGGKGYSVCIANERSKVVLELKIFYHIDYVFYFFNGSEEMWMTSLTYTRYTTWLNHSERNIKIRGKQEA